MTSGLEDARARLEHDPGVPYGFDKPLLDRIAAILDRTDPSDRAGRALGAKVLVQEHISALAADHPKRGDWEKFAHDLGAWKKGVSRFGTLWERFAELRREVQ